MPYGPFDGSLEDVDGDAVRRLIAKSPAENLFLEIKEDLGDGNRPSRWNDGENDVPPKARDDIAKEIIAFANADGGTLILGVSELKDGGVGRADELRPMRACADLADRFRRSLADTIEPPLTGLEIEGVATEIDGSGVVVIRTPPSSLAPHRSRSKLICYVRRGDQSVPLDMRGIQDLVRQRDASVNALRDRFDRFRVEFNAALNPIFQTGSGAKQVLYRLLAVPLENLNADLRMVTKGGSLLRNRTEAGTSEVQRGLLNAKPVLGGRLIEDIRSLAIIRTRVRRDGSFDLQAEVRTVELKQGMNGPRVFAPEELATSLAGLFDWVRTLRTQHHGGLGFAVQISAYKHPHVQMSHFGGRGFSVFQSGAFGETTPIYELRSAATFNDDVQMIASELFGGFGDAHAGNEYEFR